MMSALQRTFTGDEYDHVALILRYSNGDLFLFESTNKLVRFQLIMVRVLTSTTGKNLFRMNFKICTQKSHFDILKLKEIKI